MTPVLMMPLFFVCFSYFSFDPKDGEAPSEGEDDEDANGFNGSDGTAHSFVLFLSLSVSVRLLSLTQSHPPLPPIII